MKVNIGPFVDEGDREISVEIDDYDIWNGDETLSLIILPFLKRFQQDKQGTPFTEESDAPQFPDDPNLPEYERGFNDERWDWILNEMIWAFEQNLDPDHDDPFWKDTGVPGESPFATRLGINKQELDREGWLAHEARIKNGMRLFGTYLRALWT